MEWLGLEGTFRIILFHGPLLVRPNQSQILLCTIKTKTSQHFHWESWELLFPLKADGEVLVHGPAAPGDVLCHREKSRWIPWPLLWCPSPTSWEFFRNGGFSMICFSKAFPKRWDMLRLFPDFRKTLSNILDIFPQGIL